LARRAAYDQRRIASLKARTFKKFVGRHVFQGPVENVSSGEEAVVPNQGLGGVGIAFNTRLNIAARILNAKIKSATATEEAEDGKGHACASAASRSWVAQ
jgi:hypothetical protein